MSFFNSLIIGVRFNIKCQVDFCQSKFWCQNVSSHWKSWKRPLSRASVWREEKHVGKQTDFTDITVPKRKKRDEFSVLNALASTARKDFQAAQYKYIDDPYLIPCSGLEKRSFALSRASGQKSAEFVVKNYPQYFGNNIAEPGIDCLMPPVTPKLTDNSLESLRERIDLRLPLSAYENYQKLHHSGMSVPMNLIEDLLDLLCVYNSGDPPEQLPLLELYFKREITPQDKTHKVLKTWKDKGAAETLFTSLTEPSVRAQCSIIRGRAKYFQAEQACQLFWGMRQRGQIPDLPTYSAVLGMTVYLKDHGVDRIDMMKDLLSDMSSVGVSPDLHIFNIVLHCLSRSHRYSGAITYAMQTINEMKRCAIEPSLASWYYITQLMYSHEDTRSSLLSDIINLLTNQTLTFRDPSDNEFFSTAMVKCCLNLKDLDLAYRIDRLVNSVGNETLLGDSHRQALYYTNFLRLLFMFERFDVAMQYYYKLIPNTYTAPYKVFEDLLTAMDLNDGFEHTPQVWSDLVRFEYMRRVDLVEKLISIMSKKKHDKKLQDIMVQTCNNVCEQLQSDAKDSNLYTPLIPSGRMIGDLALVQLYADNVERAWEMFEMFIQNKKQIGGFPSDTALTALADVCIKQRFQDKIYEVLSVMCDVGCANLPDLVNQVLADNTLTDEQRHRLRNLL